MFTIIGLVIGFYAGNRLGQGEMLRPDLEIFALLFGGLAIAAIALEAFAAVFF